MPPNLRDSPCDLGSRGGSPSLASTGSLSSDGDGGKEYLPASEADQVAYQECSNLLHGEVASGAIHLPTLMLGEGYNTRQAMATDFVHWRDFFNDRQLLGARLAACRHCEGR